MLMMVMREVLNVCTSRTGWSAISYGTDMVPFYIQLRSPSSWDQIRAEFTYLLSYAPNPQGDSIIKGLIKFVDDFVRNDGADNSEFFSTEPSHRAQPTHFEDIQAAFELLDGEAFSSSTCMGWTNVRVHNASNTGMLHRTRGRRERGLSVGVLQLLTIPPLRRRPSKANSAWSAESP